MARQPIDLTIYFPVKGLYQTSSFQQQPPGTTPLCENVRAYDADERARGGQRSGIKKYCSAQVGGSSGRIDDLNYVTTFVTGTNTTTSLSKRTFVRVAVKGGNVYHFTKSAANLATGGSGALATNTTRVYSAEAFGKLYFADGQNEKVFTASNTTVNTWTASAGTLPDGGGGEKPRLIEQWRGRIVLSGIENDPHNWFMSAAGDPTDFDYSPIPEVETQAIAGNNSLAGKVGDKINCMIPYNDDLLVFGCDHSIWQMTGDPVAGGRIDLIDDTVGMAWGRPWCKAPDGAVYFFSSRGGVYRMRLGGNPERISIHTIEKEWIGLDLNTNIINLTWNDEEVGIHIHITRLDVTGQANHYFYDVRNEAWWKDTYPDNLNPVAIKIFDGDEWTDRTILIGSEDGYVRELDSGTFDDDGTLIESFVWIGPIMVGEGRDTIVLTELAASVANTGGGSVSWEVYGYNCANELADAFNLLQLEDEGFIWTEDGLGFIALDGGTVAPLSTGTFDIGCAVTHNPRVRAKALYLRLYNNTASETWASEWLRLRMQHVVSAHKRRSMV